MIANAKAALEALRAHRLRRESKVLRCLAAGAQSIESLTPPVYDDVPAERHAWARLTLEAHLIKLAREGRVAETGGRWSLTTQ